MNKSFYFFVAIFFLMSFCLGFMVADSKEIISVTSKQTFQTYVIVCEFLIVLFFLFIIVFRDDTGYYQEAKSERLKYK